MSEENDPPLISKKYLYLLPVAALLVAYNLLFNPDARALVGLKPGKGISLNLFKRKGGTVIASAVKAPAFSSKALDEFSVTLTQHELPQGLVIVKSEPVIEKKGETEEEKALRLAEEKRRKEEEERLKMAYLWPVRVQGAYQDLQGRWTAIVSGHNVYAGDKLASGSSDKCVYSLLAIGNHCVWMRVIPPGADSASLAALPENVTWPDVALIELDRKFLRPDYVPARVRLGNGATLGKNDALKYRTTDTTFKVKELWMNGVVFVASNNGASAEVASVLVKQ